MDITTLIISILLTAILLYVLGRLTTGTCNNTWFTFHKWKYKYDTDIKASEAYLGFNVYYRNITRTCKKCGKIEDVK